MVLHELWLPAGDYELQALDGEKAEFSVPGVSEVVLKGRKR